MSLQQHSTVLITENFNPMKAFYQGVLRQEIENDFGNCVGFTSGIALWELKPEYPLTQRLGRTYDRSGNKNLEICFEVNNFEETVQHLREHAIEYLHDIEEETWGQQTIRFYDPDRNLIEIGESIACFVKRFYNQGMTPEEVSQRTSVSLELVKKCIAE